MKRRMFGFLLGISFGFGAVYFLWRRRNNSPNAMGLSATPDTASLPQKEASSTETTTTTKPVTKYVVRRTGPRPQGALESADAGNEASINVKVTRSTEPAAATETDASAASSRAEGFAEPALPIAEVESAEVDLPKPEKVGSASNSTNEQGNDDFLPIVGIGEVFNRLLHDKGITTYKTFLALSAEQIAEKTGIPQYRIEREKWHEQVTQLLENSGVDKSDSGASEQPQN